MFHKLHDNRVKCYSVMAEMKLGQYIELIETTYKKSGGIEGQRAPLKTKTGITIRARLVEDIISGAIIPPVVVGVLLDCEDYKKTADVTSVNQFLDAARNSAGDRISVIDGMQRTTAMLEATKHDSNVSNHVIRVEFWIADKVSSLIYRMLVLNTGQVPWEIGRQLETIYGQFLTQIRNEIGNDIDIFTISDNKRRVQAGQYQSKSIIELLLIFSSRKTEIDIKDRVAEDFARLDAIETTSHSDFLIFFTNTLRMMASIDRELARVESNHDANRRLNGGKDIFASFPAMAGFFASVAIELFDEPGFKIDWQGANQRISALQVGVNALALRMRQMSVAELTEFIQLDLLEERLSQRSGQVGRFERELFRRAFSSLFRNAARLQNLAPCWMA